MNTRSQSSRVRTEHLALESEAIAWLTDHPLTGSFFHEHLQHKRFDQTQVQGMEPHFTKLAGIFNDLTMSALYSNHQRPEQPPNRKQFSDRLKRNRDNLQETLAKDLPNLNEPQVTILSQLLQGWHWRVLDNFSVLRSKTEQAR
jgi:hypothetical protein